MGSAISTQRIPLRCLCIWCWKVVLIMLFQLIPLVHWGFCQTFEQGKYFALNPYLFRDVFACENKEHCTLSFSLRQKAINNVFLFSIRFTHQAFDAVAIMTALKIAFGSAEHHLCWIRCRQFHRLENQCHSSHFDRLSGSHELLDPFFQGQPFGASKGLTQALVSDCGRVMIISFYLLVG